MLTEFLVTVFYKNKTFENPILGKMSCDVIKQSFYECKKHHAFKQKEQACADQKYIMQQCYTLNKPQDINDFIMKEFKQAYVTTSFLESRKSSLTQKLFDNSWSVFYNKANLKKFQKYMDRLQAQTQAQNKQMDNKMNTSQ